MVSVIQILAEAGKAGGPQKLGEPVSGPLDADRGVGGFLCFLCRETSCKDNVLSPFPPQMKRAGTTGSARGMALYEEEVSTEWVWQLQSGSGIALFPPRPSPSLLFLPTPPACWFT